MNIKMFIASLLFFASPVFANQQEDPSSISSDVTEQVHKWAEAWTDRDFETYASFYGEGFKPARGLSRSQWERVRKARILKRSKLKVTIEDIKVDVLSSDQAIAKFDQKYWSKSYRDKRHKTLSFVKVEDKWVIVSEDTIKCRGNTVGGCAKPSKKLKRSRK